MLGLRLNPGLSLVGLVFRISRSLDNPLPYMHLVGCPWTLLHPLGELAWPIAGPAVASEHFGLLQRVWWVLLESIDLLTPTSVSDRPALHVL